MTGPTPSESLLSDDLESTSELPVLDVTAFETPTAWKRARAASEAVVRPSATLERPQTPARAPELEHELAQLRDGLAERDAQLAWLREEADRALMREQQLRDAQAMAESRIQELVAMAGQHSAALAERDAELVRLRAVSAVSLEQTAALEHARSRCEELEAAQQAQAQRSERLEAELARLRKDSEDAAFAGAGDVAAAALEELRAQLASKEEALEALQETARASTLYQRELGSELRVAEESLRRAGLEVADLTAQLEKAQQSEGQLRTAAREAQAAERAARGLLAYRDALIQGIREELQALKDEALKQRALQSQEEPPEPGSAPHQEDSTEPGPSLPPEPELAALTRLLIRTDSGSEIAHVLGERTRIGRSADNDMQVDITSVSRHHALILAEPTRTVIEDLNSTNGVRVNGQRVSREALRDGDMVAIGKARFRFALRAVVDAE
jgi:chromosome segregation ATPase